MLTSFIGLNQPTFITNIVVTIDLTDLDLPPDQPVFVDVDFTVNNSSMLIGSKMQLLNISPDP